MASVESRAEESGDMDQEVLRDEVNEAIYSLTETSWNDEEMTTNIGIFINEIM